MALTVLALLKAFDGSDLVLELVELLLPICSEKLRILLPTLRHPHLSIVFFLGDEAPPARNQEDWIGHLPSEAASIFQADLVEVLPVQGFGSRMSQLLIIVDQLVENLCRSCQRYTLVV